MPNQKHTKIEITQDAYLALEAESLLQRKTLKKLASELILNGVSKKALDFIKEVNTSLAEDAQRNESKKAAKVVEKLGNTRIHIDEGLLKTLENILRTEGYVSAMLYVAQHTASMERDELHRVLSICDQNKLPPELTADIIKNLNKIDSTNFL